jgi:RNA polymerase sigma factor (TIGR02999 family)
MLTFSQMPAAENVSRERISTLVSELVEGGAAEDLLPVVYEELRRLAQWHMGNDAGQTLQPTALVHEAYLRLAQRSRTDWRGRTHFIAFASKVMRNLLIDRARGRASAKRGGDKCRVTLAEHNSPSPGHELDADQLLSLNAALDRLAEKDERAARIVELRFFGGLKVDEVAEVLGVSKRTVEGHWTHARAWLARELSVTGPQNEL